MKRLGVIASVLSCAAMCGCDLVYSPPPSFGGDGPPDTSYIEGKNQDVIPINGDSSGPVDEIMDGGGLQLISFHASPLLPAARPLTIYRKRADGDVDVRIVTGDGLTPPQFAERMQAPIVLAPVRASMTAAIERDIAARTRRGSGIHVTRARLRAYCVEAAKPSAPPGTLYMVAPPEIAHRFDAVQGLLRVADGAVARGVLKPQGDPQAYGRFIAQYAAWTKLEGWDQSRFTTEFLARTRRQFDQQRKDWTSETEQTLRVLAPARWRDVQRVIESAEKPSGQTGERRR